MDAEAAVRNDGGPGARYDQAEDSMSRCGLHGDVLPCEMHGTTKRAHGECASRIRTAEKGSADGGDAADDDVARDHFRIRRRPADVRLELAMQRRRSECQYQRSP